MTAQPKQSASFTVDRTALLATLVLLRSAVAAKRLIPILSAVLIEAHKDGLTLTTTDMDVSLRCHVEATVSAPFAKAVDLALLTSLVSRAPLGEIEIMIDGERLKISWPGTELKLSAWDAEHYPSIHATKETPWMIPTATMLGMIKRAGYAVGSEDSRYALACVRWKCDGKQFEMVSTDGQQLPIVTAESGDAKPFEVLIPAKTTTALKALLEEDGDDLAFGYDDNRLYFTLGTTHLISRQTSGKFPTVEKCISETTRSVTLGTIAVVNALQTLLPVADMAGGNRLCGVRWDISKRGLTLSGTSHDIGEGRIEIATEYNDEPVSLGLNSRWVLNALAAVGSERFELKFSDEETPPMIVPVGDDSFRCVLWMYRLD